MGTYQSKFEKNTDQKASKLTAKEPEWITGNADETGMAVVEVQRYWNRFLQLGGNSLGVIDLTALESGELTQDVIIKNIISNLPKDDLGRLSFAVFLNFLQWLETAEVREKLKVIHSFLNNGQPLNDKTFTRIVKRLNPNHSEDEVKVTVDLLMVQLDPKRTNNITESQFVDEILKNYDEYELSEIIVSELIPKNTLEELNMHPKISSDSNDVMKNIRSKTNLRRSNDYQGGSQILDDRTLEAVAKKAINRDWEKLAIKLGFLEYDISTYKLKNRGYNYETMVEILMEWRDQDPTTATKARLKRYLDDSNMNDASSLLR